MGGFCLLVELHRVGSALQPVQQACLLRLPNKLPPNRAAQHQGNGVNQEIQQAEQGQAVRADRGQENLCPENGQQRQETSLNLRKGTKPKDTEEEQHTPLVTQPTRLGLKT